MIIAFAHQKGGVGKSTLADIAAVRMGAEILDLDSQHSSAIFCENRVVTLNMNEEMRKDWKQEGHRPVPLTAKAVKCYTIAESHSDLEQQTPVPESELIPFLKEYMGNPGKNLVVDCGGFKSGYNAIAMSFADLIITPVSPMQIEVYGLETFKKVLDETEEATGRTDPIVSHVLINRADNRSPKDIADLRDYVNSESKHFILMNSVMSLRQVIPRAWSNGLTVEEADPSSPAVGEVERLVSEIRSVLSETEK